ncbi:MAG TPA: hypothetical protein VMT95_12565 [Candidatus Binatia bacterium]|nr:hypothetical protein [Candidatus Binatia bacterium]
MDPLEQLRARIAGFPGYDGDLERRRSDEFVRSYLGEALADLEVRCGSISPELRQRFDALLLRVGFADQKAFHHVVARVHAAPNVDSSIAVADVATVDLASQAPQVEPDRLARYLDEVAATLDRRDAAMRAAAASNA